MQVPPHRHDDLHLLFISCSVKNTPPLRPCGLKQAPGAGRAQARARQRHKRKLDELDGARGSPFRLLLRGPSRIPLLLKHLHLILQLVHLHAQLPAPAPGS